MSKRVKMLTTHASANEVLDDGKVYLVSDELAASLMAKGSGADGKPAARLAKQSEIAKARRVPAKPDPGETDEATGDDDDDEDDEDNKGE